MKYRLLYIFTFFSSIYLFGQNLPNDCMNFIQVCDNQSVSYNVSGAGVQEIVPPSCSSQENNSLWLRVTIAQGGTLGFNLIPNSQDINEDYDFWVFGPNSDCDNLGSPIRCSTTNPAAASQSNNHTGLNASSTDFTEGPGIDGDSFVSQLSTFAGESYFIVIDRPIGNSPFTLNWTGDSIIANPFSTQSFDEFDDLIVCDQGADNMEMYDFTELTIPYLGSITGYTLTYFASMQDASFNSNELLGTTTISQGTYFARIKHDNSSCFIVKPLQVIFNSLPTIQVIACDDTFDDGVFDFDTTTLENDLLNGLTGFSVSYSDENNNPLPSPLLNPFPSSEQIVTATLTSNTGSSCTFDTTIEFIIYKKPEFFAIPTNLTTKCSVTNSQSQVNTASFDTSVFNSILVGNQSRIDLEFYNENNQQLASPLPNPFVSTSQNVTVKIINSDDPNCFTTGIITFLALPLPDVHFIGNEEFVCLNLPSYFVNLDAGLLNPSQQANFSYQWFLNNVALVGATSYNLQVNQAGNYSVNITNVNNCEVTRTILVSESNIAIINDVEVYDFSDDNTLIIDATGIGIYEYSLDNINYQASNVFDEVLPGIYNVYVKDERNCGITLKKINVLGAPKFFTPNGDGFNEFWNIKGVDSQLNAKTIIRIYDRFGKFLAQINPLSFGWDGTFNNKKLPADDYWYTIELLNGRTVKGHFSLIR